MTQIDLNAWRKEGYYVLPGFYSHEEIDTALDAQLTAFDQSHPRIVVDVIPRKTRKLLADVTAEERQNCRFKINDLYLELPTVRAMALNGRITPVLEELLGHTPVLCNSLSFERGSTQGNHVDSLYMTPHTDGHLIAIWVALEDCHPDAGPLRYYPGSHEIEPYIFSTGSRHVVQSEMFEWDIRMHYELKRRGIKAVTFNAKKGDVFVWSCNLMHGGEPIRNPSLTRRSMVFHYYSHSDSKAIGLDVLPFGGAYWMYRNHQAVNGIEGELPPRPQF